MAVNHPVGEFESVSHLTRKVSPGGEIAASAWATIRFRIWIGTGSAVVEFTARIRALEERVAELEAAARAAKP